MERDALARFAAEKLSASLAELYVSHIRDHAELTPVRGLQARSWLGGLPTAIELDQWPERNGRPLSFLAHIDLADIAKVQTNLSLPNSGSLSFFVDTEDTPWGHHPEDRHGWSVVYTPPSKGTLHEPTAQTTVFNRVDLGVEQGVSSPCLYEPVVGAIYRDENEGLGDLHWIGHAGHQVGGWPRLQQDSIWSAAQFGYEGIAYFDRGRPGYMGAPGPPGWDDWLLLLQLDTDDSAEWMWADGGMLYFSIRQQDLVALRFDQCWMALQC